MDIKLQLCSDAQHARCLKGSPPRCLHTQQTNHNTYSSCCRTRIFMPQVAVPVARGEQREVQQLPQPSSSASDASSVHVLRMWTTARWCTGQRGGHGPPFENGIFILLIVTASEPSLFGLSQHGWQMAHYPLNESWEWLLLWSCRPTVRNEHDNHTTVSFGAAASETMKKNPCIKHSACESQTKRTERSCPNWIFAVQK